MSILKLSSPTLSMTINSQSAGFMLVLINPGNSHLSRLEYNVRMGRTRVVVTIITSGTALFKHNQVYIPLDVGLIDALFSSG